MQNFKIFLNIVLLSSLFFLANAVDYSTMTAQQKGEALVKAAEYRDFRAVVNLVNAGVDVNFQRHEDKCAALHWAAFNNDFRTGKFLIEHHANVNLQSDIKDTPLIALLKSNRDMVYEFPAIYDKSAQVFRILDGCVVLEEVAQIPLNKASNKSESNLASLLDLDKNGKCRLIIDTSDGKNYWFLNYQNDDETKRFLAIYSDDSLQKACIVYKRNYFEFMELLLKCGAKVNMQNKKGETALGFAAAVESIEKCDILLKYGARTDISDNRWVYPFDLVSDDNKVLQEKLLNQGVSSITYMFKLLFR